MVDAIASRIGPKRTSIRLAPWNDYQGMRMKDPVPTFSYLVSELKVRQPEIAYLHVVEGQEPGDSNDFLRDIWKVNGGVFLSAGGHQREDAFEYANKGDVVVFGRWFISNVSHSHSPLIFSVTDLTDHYFDDSPTFPVVLKITFLFRLTIQKRFTSGKARKVTLITHLHKRMLWGRMSGL